jgi:GNAT superfamily N-acetyltransferase
MTDKGLRSVVSMLRRTPPFLVMQMALRHVPFRPVDVGKLCFLRLDKLPSVPAGMLRGSADVGAATPDDLPELIRLQAKEETFRDRFKSGDHCVVARVDGRIVGYEWFCDGDAHCEALWGLAIPIPGDFVYAYDAYIDPAYRNSGIWLRFKAYLGNRMRETGKRGVLTFVDYGNWPSLRTHLRFGFAPAETVLALNVLGMKMFRRVKNLSTTGYVLVYSAMTHHALALRLAHAVATVKVR